MNVLVETKKNLGVMKLLMGLHHMYLKVVELVIELHHKSPRVVKLLLRPHHIDSYIHVNQWMHDFTREINESSNELEVIY